MPKAQQGVRIMKADRSQLNWDLVDLDAWPGADHRARIVWAFVETLDLGDLYAGIKARGSKPGRPGADPKVLLALWLLATIEGIGSARELDRLVKRDLAYRWMAGGVPLNYHGLSDFRVGHADVLDRLMTMSLAAMMAEGLVRLDEMIVDGTIAPAIIFRWQRRRQTVSSIKATDRREDSGLASVMVDEVERHPERRPKKLIADTGYATASDIVELAGNREHQSTRHHLRRGRMPSPIR